MVWRQGGAGEFGADEARRVGGGEAGRVGWVGLVWADWSMGEVQTGPVAIRLVERMRDDLDVGGIVVPPGYRVLMSRPRAPRYAHRTMLPDPETCIDLGRLVVADGRLKALRNRLGITRSAMSELLYTNMVTYADWERRPNVNLRRNTAERVGRFYWTAKEQLEILEHEGYDPDDHVSLGVVSTKLGVAQEVLFQWYKEGRLPAVDAGLLGLWVSRDDLARLRGRRG